MTKVKKFESEDTPSSSHGKNSDIKINEIESKLPTNLAWMADANKVSIFNQFIV